MDDETQEQATSASGRWGQIAEWHRSQERARDAAVPFGFAGRIAARWREERSREIAAAWERLSWRAAFASSVVAVVMAGGGMYGERALAGEEELIPVLDAGSEQTEWWLP